MHSYNIDVWSKEKAVQRLFRSCSLLFSLVPAFQIEFINRFFHRFGKKCKYMFPFRNDDGDKEYAIDWQQMPKDSFPKGYRIHERAKEIVHGHSLDGEEL